jgi:hypothetical protein
MKHVLGTEESVDMLDESTFDEINASFQNTLFPVCKLVLLFTNDDRGAEGKRD